MEAYNKFMGGELPHTEGIITIAAEFIDSEYSVENKLKDLATNMSAISEKARIITIPDKFGNSVLVVKERSYIHARYLSKRNGGIASNPNRVKLLPTNLEVFILEFNILLKQDILDAMDMKLHETAKGILFKFYSYEDGNEVIPSEYVRFFTFRYIDTEDTSM